MNKTILELMPMLISCGVVAIICFGFILYFLIPRKANNFTGEKHLVDQIEEDISSKGLIQQDEKSEPALQVFFEKLNGKELYCIETNKIASIMYTLKIVVFLYLLLTPILQLTLFFLGYVTTFSKFLIFLCPALAIIVPIAIPIYYQSTAFSYTITTKCIILNYGTKIIRYPYCDIAKIKLKYGFFVKNKKFGSIKIKSKEKTLALFSNSLYLINDPEIVYKNLCELILISVRLNPS